MPPTPLQELQGGFGPPAIPFAEIRFGRELARGAFGIVFDGVVRGTKVAIKVPHKQTLSDKEWESFRREVDALRRVFHPNVVLFLGGCIADPKTNPGEKIALVMQLVETDLQKLLQRDRDLLLGVDSTSKSAGLESAAAALCLASSKYASLAAGGQRSGGGSEIAAGQHAGLLSLKKRLELAHDAATGMAWLHGMKMVHRDLKPANLLVDSEGRVKVTDFGFAVFRDLDELGQMYQDPKEHNQIIGTPLYMAPQLLSMDKGANYFAGDVYAMGMILWEVMTSMELFTEFSQWKEFTTAICVRNVRPPTSREVSQLTSPREGLATWAPDIWPSISDIMTHCWQTDPQDRPSMADIVTKLEGAKLEPLIMEPSARQFWAEHWGASDIAPWDEFQEKISEAAGGARESAAAIESLLAAPGLLADRLVVSAERFNRAVVTYGRFFSDPDVLQFTADFVQQPWWKGDIGRSDAEYALRDSRVGVFLVRGRALDGIDDNNEPFAISFCTLKGKKISIEHRLIRYNPFSASSTPWSMLVLKERRAFNTIERLLQDPDAHCTTPVGLKPPVAYVGEDEEERAEPV